MRNWFPFNFPQVYLSPPCTSQHVIVPLDLVVFKESDIILFFNIFVYIQRNGEGIGMLQPTKKGEGKRQCAVHERVVALGNGLHI